MTADTSTRTRASANDAFDALLDLVQDEQAARIRDLQWELRGSATLATAARRERTGRAMMQAVAERTTEGHYHGSPDSARRLLLRLADRMLRPRRPKNSPPPKRLQEYLDSRLRNTTADRLSAILRYLESKQATRPETCQKLANVARAAGISLENFRRRYLPALTQAGLLKVERGPLGGAWLTTTGRSVPVSVAECPGIAG